MTDYWKMNRIGFVNFWLYDEEIFEFIDGKLLLRGQNASGKSITTQSFIPFILDGDKTPSRLDPFGSSDRRMEYYFLGEEGKEEATGYLFLEFKKEEKQEYRTIAIGQRARRGKPMDFWGFVILDGRRVGIDINFYKETGNTKIPYDKQLMRKVLGEEVPFTDIAGEYKAMVNKYLFGFLRPEQYEQFIRLLIKVRAPKLSKEFKPTKVYEILNESLQTLTDEDLRAMVDAMEKMDGIQENLEQLQRAISDIKSIRNEYSRYNQYMLARKGQAYLEKKREAEQAQGELEYQEKEKQDLSNAEVAKRKAKEKLEDREKLVHTELENLLDTDMEEAELKLEKVKSNQEEAERYVQKEEEQIERCKTNLNISDRKRKELENKQNLSRELVTEKKEELSEIQEILQWKEHGDAIETAGMENSSRITAVAGKLKDYQKQIVTGKVCIEKHDAAKKEYDAVLEEYEKDKKEVQEQEEAYKAAEEQVQESVDHLIAEFYQMPKQNQEWIPEAALLSEIELKLDNYKETGDAEQIRIVLRKDYEKNQTKLQNKRSEVLYNSMEQEKRISELERRAQLLMQKEIEPERSESISESRKAMEEAGIPAVPFYKAVEFAEGLTDEECSKLELQLKMMGILDALVVPQNMAAKVEESFPQFMDTILYTEKEGTGTFSKLKVNEELSPELQKAVTGILTNIQESCGADSKVYIGSQGAFQQGMLRGRANAAEPAAFVGVLARKRKKEQLLQDLQEEIDRLKKIVEELQKEKMQIEDRLQVMSAEYQRIPEFTEINQRIEMLRKCEMKLQLLREQLDKKFVLLQSADKKCSSLYQEMLQCCKALPYGRTLADYQEAENAAEEYQQGWQELFENVRQLEHLKQELIREQEESEKEELRLDEAFQEKRKWSNKAESYEIEKKKYENYLNREDIREKAQRRSELKQEENALRKEQGEIGIKMYEINRRLSEIRQNEINKKQRLQETIANETILRKYFEEELELNLVLKREGKTVPECAGEAVSLLRERDRGKEPQDILNDLYRVYQQHNSNLSQYGTALEDCFEEGENKLQATRKRVLIVSVWNGKKLYLEEFYQVIKNTIEETELLIQQKDRELFEDILSQTITQQLTERIAESRKWVEDMSALMKNIDTSMGLTFSLSWKPKTAENDKELDTSDLEHILLRDRELLTIEDIERVAMHFRSKIKTEKEKLLEDGGVINYMELVRDALDYRKWFEFKMSYKRSQEERKPLSNAVFNRFSGGEKAMAMYVPLFAAVNAQYKKASKADHPKIIALDEAFAGVDDKNISSMFQLVESLDFDYIMNSQVLWGCYETVKGLKIAELLRPLNSQVVTVIQYIWNGHERILNE